MAPRIKICGITRLSDGEHAIACGAHYIGMIFVPGTPRFINEADALAIARALKGKVKLVGVFRDQDPDQVLGMAERLDLDFVQCHGKETPQYIARMTVPVIKTIEVTQGEDLDLRIKAYEGADIAHFLIDKPKTENIAADSVPRLVERFERLLGDYFLAGALTPHNVVSMLSGLRPFAVDVCSGVEASHGLKDPLKVEEFCRNCGEISCQNQA